MQELLKNDNFIATSGAMHIYLTTKIQVVSNLCRNKTTQPLNSKQLLIDPYRHWPSHKEVVIVQFPIIGFFTGERC